VSHLVPVVYYHLIFDPDAAYVGDRQQQQQVIILYVNRWCQRALSIMLAYTLWIIQVYMHFILMPIFREKMWNTPKPLEKRYNILEDLLFRICDIYNPIVEAFTHVCLWLVFIMYFAFAHIQKGF
ncbi:hypothetical protein ACJX0J_030498, partial [Zea mays]